MAARSLFAHHQDARSWKTAISGLERAQQQVKKVLGNGFVEQLNQAIKRVSTGGAAR